MNPGDTFRLRDIAVVAYGPTVVNAIGHGAVLAILALRARDLGADVGTAAFIVSLMPLGSLASSLPVGALVARIGERRALALAGFVDAATMLFAAATSSLALLAVAVTLSGVTWTTFLMARQGFMIDVVPLTHRARAMAALGGSNRVGVFLGPLLGAGLIQLTDLRAVFVLASAMSAISGGMALLMPDLGAERRSTARDSGHHSVWSVLARHRTVLLTLGSAVVVISASRAVRSTLLPLWCDHVGLSASTTSLIFALAGLVDIVFFLPGGWLMDHAGRAAVAVPVVFAVAVGALVLPLTGSAWSVALVACLIALGNGFGSGIVMTLGADAAPAVGRAQFLGGWRLCGDIGSSGAPLLVSALATVAPLAAASVVVGLLAVVGTAWVGWWTHREDVRLRALSPPAPPPRSTPR